MSDSPEADFHAALSAFWTEMPKVRKGEVAQVRSDKGNYSYAYADLTDITEIAAPILAKHGLSFTARPMLTDTAFVLRYALLHAAGHREEGDYPLPDPGRSTPQQIGSAITYARRYSLCAVTGIAPGGDDDEGKQAETTARQKPQRGKQEPVPEATTDTVWLEDVRARLPFCSTAGEVRGLWSEATDARKSGRLAEDDWTALKREMNARVAELKGTPDAA